MRAVILCYFLVTTFTDVPAGNDGLGLIERPMRCEDKAAIYGIESRFQIMMTPIAVLTVLSSEFGSSCTTSKPLSSP